MFQKGDLDAGTEKKIDAIRSSVMRSVEKELVRSLKESMAQ